MLGLAEIHLTIFVKVHPLTTDLQWDAEAPATAANLRALAAATPFPLPEAYLDWLRRGNGGDGPISLDPGWLVCWCAEDVPVANAEYGVPFLAPGFWAFGSNGREELLAFDFRSSPAAIVMLPLEGLAAEEAIRLAPSFEDFLELAFQREG
ncbi:hypothetical protein GCM10023213_36460 [Prosthecobacter algae]|uniref:Knr4/Smi1-like domain-containing protein n=1 Tax=Prosthecobacter algae TaxID=1144682 RepID=A0ABP9PEB8_9BACT